MSITIYWAFIEDEWLRAKEPEPIYKKFLKNVEDKNTTIELCPSIREYMKNTFSVKSIYQYDFEIINDKNEVHSDLYDQKFFNKHVLVRSQKQKLFSFSQQFIFFTEENSLKMSAGMFPFLEDNEITKRCIPIPGIFDIGRWFRPIDFAFYLKDNYNKFEIKEDDIFQYIRFYTEEKIIFKQFYVNEKIAKYAAEGANAKDYRINKTRQLQSYYSMFKHKKNIIKEIKNNLIKG
jgi:hypothetical protein